MTNRYFSLLTPQTAIYDSHNILADTGTVYNGNLAMLGGGTSGSLILSTGSAIGIFYDQLAMQELPTTAELVANIGGERCNYASGFFEALVGADLFQGGALPTPNTTLYDYGNGLIDITARGRAITTAIGKALDQHTIQHKDGAYTVARCRFNFTQIK